MVTVVIFSSVSGNNGLSINIFFFKFVLHAYQPFPRVISAACNCSCTAEMTGRVNLYAKSLWTSQEHVKTGSVGDYVTATYFVEVTMLSFSPIARARSCARIEQSVLSANSRAGGKGGGRGGRGGADRKS